MFRDSVILYWPHGSKGNDAISDREGAGEECEIPNAKARQILTFLSDTAIREVKKNGLFVVPGLGRLVRVERKARMGRNPATGETIKIAAKRVVKFRIAKSAKDAIVPPKINK